MQQVSINSVRDELKDLTTNPNPNHKLYQSL